MNLPKIEPITWRGITEPHPEPIQPRQPEPFNEPHTQPIQHRRPSRIELQPCIDSSIISELSAYFAGVILPTKPIRLSQCETITDVQRFIETSLVMVSANNGNQSGEACLTRLLQLRKLITNLN